MFDLSRRAQVGGASAAATDIFIPLAAAPDTKFSRDKLAKEEGLRFDAAINIPQTKDARSGALRRAPDPNLPSAG